MIVLGTIFLLHTVFNVRLPVREFLPVVLVLLGAYMLFDWARARRTRTLPDFETVARTPSVFGGTTTGALPGEMTRFGTGELVTQVAARAHEPVGSWPTDPRA
jgi:hypothetical protein